MISCDGFATLWILRIDEVTRQGAGSRNPHFLRKIAMEQEFGERERHQR